MSRAINYVASGRVGSVRRGREREILLTGRESRAATDRDYEGARITAMHARAPDRSSARPGRYVNKRPTRGSVRCLTSSSGTVYARSSMRTKPYEHYRVPDTARRECVQRFFRSSGHTATRSD